MDEPSPPLGTQRLDLCQFQRYPCGARSGWAMSAQDPGLHGVVKRHFSKIDAIEAAIGWTEAVANVREDQRRTVFQVGLNV
jgi:hypothetical protein